LKEKGAPGSRTRRAALLATFYRDGLGLPTKGVVADEYEGSDTEAAGAIVIFRLKGGLILSLYPRGEFAKDARIPPTPPPSSVN
jgi:uncharacterized protein